MGDQIKIMIDMKKTSDFGTQLEKLCRERGISINELARRLSISSKTVHEWVGKSGRLPRNPEHLKKLSEFFSISIEFLLFGKERDRIFLDSLFVHSDVHTGLYEITIKRIAPNHPEKGGKS